MEESTENEKSRLTLWMAKNVKDELKRQAKNSGVSPSAYLSMIIMERKRQEQQQQG